MNNLEKQLQEQIRKQPEILIKQNAGKTIPVNCPKCGYKELLFTDEGDAICTQCNTRVDINFDF